MSALRPAPTLTAVVVAAVRPAQPNAAVIRAAARLAHTCDAELVVVATIKFYVPDWGDVPFSESAVLESYQATLFAHCAELLVDEEVRWSIHVTSQPIASTISALSTRRRVVGVVLGSGRSGRRLIRLRRRLVGTLVSSIRDVHTLVIDAER